MQKIWQEQQLAAGQRLDDVKVGRLLNADGVLTLGRQTEGANELLVVRLVAVKPGIVLISDTTRVSPARPRRSSSARTRPSWAST